MPNHAITFNRETFSITFKREKDAELVSNHQVRRSTMEEHEGEIDTNAVEDLQELVGKGRKIVWQERFCGQ